MKKLTVFYLEGCPYCIKARDAVKELLAQTPAYGEVEIEWIEESRSPAIAERYDYYYVPSVFCGEDKLYECSPRDDYATILCRIESALKTALSV